MEWKLLSGNLWDPPRGLWENLRCFSGLALCKTWCHGERLQRGASLPLTPRPPSALLLSHHLSAPPLASPHGQTKPLRGGYSAGGGPGPVPLHDLGWVTFATDAPSGIPPLPCSLLRPSVGRRRMSVGCRWENQGGKECGVPGRAEMYRDWRAGPEMETAKSQERGFLSRSSHDPRPGPSCSFLSLHSQGNSP